MNMNLPPESPPAEPTIQLPHQHVLIEKPGIKEYAATPWYFDAMPTYSGHEYNGIPISDEQWPIFQLKVAEINAKFEVEEPTAKPEFLFDRTEAVAEALEAQRNKEVNYGFITTGLEPTDYSTEYGFINTPMPPPLAEATPEIVVAQPKIPSFENIGSLALLFANQRKALYDAQA